MRVLPLSAFLLSIGLAEPLSAELAPTGLWRCPDLLPSEWECTVRVDLSDERPWEQLADPSGQSALAIQEINGVHFYRQVQVDIDEGYQLATTPPQFIAFIGEDHRREYLPTLRDMQKDYKNITPGSLNATDLLSAIREGDGVDALLLVAHGDSNSGIRFRKGASGTLTVAQLKEALMHNRRPLRFAYFMLCDLHRPLLTMLGELAQVGKLDPQFGGLVMSGSPRQDFGVLFTQKLLEEFLTNPDQQYPLLRAVQTARQLAADKASFRDALRPIVVACHAQANPLPNRLGQEMETYFRRLGDPDTVAAP